jgi:[acyl-carrier-protein] S-malonyltransferase
MLNNGVDTFMEIGSKKVLSGLIRRINRKAKTINIEKLEDIEKLEI